MGRVDEFGRFVTREAIFSVLKRFIEQKHPGAGLWSESEDIHVLRLSEELRRDLISAGTEGRGLYGRSKDGEIRFTTDGETAFRHAELELFNVSHPLVRAALKAVSEQLQRSDARIGHATLRLACNDDPGIEEGIYFIVVFILDIRGIRKRRLLEILSWSSEREEIVPAETAERLLHLVVNRGEEWSAGTPAFGLPEKGRQALRSERRRRKRQVEKEEARENRARYLRELRALEADFKRQVESLQKRINKMRRNGKDPGVIRATEGQIRKREAKYDRRKAELDGLRDPEVRLPDPVAACLVEVRRV